MSDDFDRRLLLGAAGLAGVAALAGRSKAGPINPPGGAIGSTGKTLAEVEPRIAINSVNTPPTSTAETFRITQPGSYYLTGDLNFTSGDGIRVATNDVTIDLMGFTIRGGPFSRGIVYMLNMGRVELRNGRVEGCTEGIRFDGSGKGSLIENVHGFNNGGAAQQDTGFFFGGTECVVRNCSSSGASGTGFSLAGGSVIESSRASGHTFGITLVSGVVRDCVLEGNGSSGVRAFNDLMMSGCLLRQNGSGVWALGRSLIESCTAIGNSYGFDCANGARITGCHAAQNSGSGFRLAGFSALVGNTARDNTQSGIEIVGGGSLIDQNHSSGNGAGITAAAGNMVVRNICTGNATNYSLAAGCQYGPISTRVGASSPAVNGNTAAGTTNADPNTNYSL